MGWAGQTLNKPIIVPSLASIPKGPFKRKDISSTVTKNPTQYVPNKKKNPADPDAPTKLTISASDIDQWEKNGGQKAANGKGYLVNGKGEFSVTAVYVATSQEAVNQMTSNTVKTVYYAVGTPKSYDLRSAAASSQAAQDAKARAAAEAKAKAKEDAQAKAKEEAKAKAAYAAAKSAAAIAGLPPPPPPSSTPTRSEAENKAKAKKEATDRAQQNARAKATQGAAASAANVKNIKDCEEGKLIPTIQSVRQDERNIFNVIIEGDKFRNFDGQEFTVKFIFDDGVEEYVEKVAEIVSFSKTEFVETTTTTSREPTKTNISQTTLDSLRGIMDKVLPGFNPINKPPISSAPPVPSPNRSPAVGTTNVTNPPLVTSYTPTLTTQISTSTGNITPATNISVVTITETAIDTGLLLSGSTEEQKILQEKISNLDIQKLGALNTLGKIKLR